jgi:hypothetical protein
MPHTHDMSVRIFANASLDPMIVPLSQPNGQEWSGALKITMEGYPANGWPEVEVLPDGAGTMSLVSITTRPEWWAPPPMPGAERTREPEPFGAPVSTAYLYRFVEGSTTPTCLRVRWQDRVEAQARWKAEEELGATPAGSKLVEPRR